MAAAVPQPRWSVRQDQSAVTHDPATDTTTPCHHSWRKHPYLALYQQQWHCISARVRRSGCKQSPLTEMQHPEMPCSCPCCQCTGYESVNRSLPALTCSKGICPCSPLCCRTLSASAYSCCCSSATALHASASASLGASLRTAHRTVQEQQQHTQGIPYYRWLLVIGSPQLLLDWHWARNRLALQAI